MAEWRYILGYGDLYEVSDLGGVRNARTGEPKKLWINDDGYHTVSLCRDGKWSGHMVHRLMLMTFVGPTPGNKKFGLHRNGNSQDNHLSNLYWGTQSENVLDSVRHGTHQSARKTQCSRGHELSGTNLSIRRGGKRACKSCDAGRVAYRRGKTLSIQEYADQLYRAKHQTTLTRVRLEVTEEAMAM